MRRNKPSREIALAAARAAGTVTQVSANDIMGGRKFRCMALARFIAMKLLHEHGGGYSLTGIGLAFGRDHTTVLYALRDKRGLVAPEQMAEAREYFQVELGRNAERLLRLRGMSAPDEVAEP